MTSPVLTYPPSASDTLPHVVIIGGGLTGLSAGFYLSKAARANGAPLQYTIVERNTRLGGKVLTETISEPDQFIVEGGPDSFVAQKPAAIELARELGLGDQLMSANEARRTVYVLRNGKPCPMPDGMLLIIPTRFWPFIVSPLLSPLGKLRMGMDLLIPPRRDDGDETLADFIRRRFGSEALDRLAEPLMAGIHSAESERQSLMATFPRFRAMEQKYGSIIRGMLAARRMTKDEGRKTADERHKTQDAQRTNASSSPFMTLRGGIGTLVDALAARQDGRVITGAGVAKLAHDPHASPAYRILLTNGEELYADAVVLTTPSYTAADLMEPLRPALAHELRQIRHVSTATITLAYRRSEIGEPLDGVGVIIPPSERRRINACTITSTKFAHRAPDDYTLVRVFVGGSRTPESLRMDDPALVAMIRKELQDILGISAEPVFYRIYRWPDSNPQYDIGHLDRMTRIDALCPDGLYLIGSAYHGIGIPDCVKQGKDAASRILTQIAQTAHTL
jgi:oxygen-dependent protoporphyrinogen oxidase